MSQKKIGKNQLIVIFLTDRQNHCSYSDLTFPCSCWSWLAWGLPAIEKT
jgi:hypothetical protein